MKGYAQSSASAGGGCVMRPGRPAFSFRLLVALVFFSGCVAIAGPTVPIFGHTRGCRRFFFSTPGQRVQPHPEMADRRHHLAAPPGYADGNRCWAFRDRFAVGAR